MDLAIVLLLTLNTIGVPIPNPIMSNMFMCLRNSPTLEQEAQRGPQVFLPLEQHLREDKHPVI